MPFHNRRERFSVLVAHRRAGKTVATLNDMLKQAITCRKPNGRYAYVAPFLSQAKEVAWEYLKRFSYPITRRTNESELWVELINGARMRCHGADNQDRLRGGYLDGVVLDEYADMRPSVWGEVIRPMLADREGWATFIGTPKGRNEFYDKWVAAEDATPPWFRMMLRASDSGLIRQSELDDAARDMTPEQYAQEFECSFEAAIQGAYYARELAELDRQDRIGDVPCDASMPVHTAWDLGMGDSTAIWFWQATGGELRIIDFYENSGEPLNHYFLMLNRKKYKYGTHWLPHDARVRSMDTGKTRVETLKEYGLRVRIASEQKLMDGINATRVVLPSCRFDAKNCFAGLEALRHYRCDYDEKKKTFKDTPRHDWASHAADAFRYLALAFREETVTIKPPQPTDTLGAMLKQQMAAAANKEMRR